MSLLNEALYGAQRSAIREFSRLAKQTPGCVSLTLGEPDFDTPLPVIDAACEALHNHETHYIENNGAMGLREAIAQFEREYALCEAAGPEDDVALPAWTVQTVTGKPTAYADPTVWTNESMAHYFGVKSVRTEEQAK